MPSPSPCPRALWPWFDHSWASASGPAGQHGGGILGYRRDQRVLAGEQFVHPGGKALPAADLQHREQRRQQPRRQRKRGQIGFVPIFQMQPPHVATCFL